MLLSLCCSVVFMLYCYCVALLLFVLSYVLIVCTVPLPPCVNPIADDKYIYLSFYLSIYQSFNDDIQCNGFLVVFLSEQTNFMSVLLVISGHRHACIVRVQRDMEPQKNCVTVSSVVMFPSFIGNVTG